MYSTVLILIPIPSYIAVADPGFQKGRFHFNTDAYSQALPDSCAQQFS